MPTTTKQQKQRGPCAKCERLGTWFPGFGMFYCSTHRPRRRGLPKKAADASLEMQAYVAALRCVYSCLPASQRRVVDEYIRDAERRKRLPSYNRTARAANTTARKVQRIITGALRLAGAREKGMLKEERLKVLRPAERAEQRRTFYQDIRNGNDPSTGRPWVVPEGSTYIDPVQGLANVFKVGVPFVRDLCDVFADLADRAGTGRTRQVETAIQPLLGAGRRNLETIFAALVLEHLREQNGGRLPFFTAWLVAHPVDVRNGRPVRYVKDKNGPNGPGYYRVGDYSTITDNDKRTWYKSHRSPSIDHVAVLCGKVFPRSRLNVRPRVRSGEITIFPAMGRRLKKRIEKLSRSKVRKAYLKIKYPT